MGKYTQGLPLAFLNYTKMHCFACISLMTPWIPFGLFTSYAVYLPLSTPTICPAVFSVPVELSSVYCLFGTTWLSTPSCVSYGLNSYLDGLQSEKTCINIAWYHYLCTICRYRSPAGCRWVTVFQFTTLILLLFCTDSRTIPMVQCYSR
jgi:hypothetical protein